jgi:cyclopropane-fatty-acyl-phospholipid synthase
MRTLLTALISDLVKTGSLDIVYASGARQTFGDGSGEKVVARFTDARAPFDLMRNPELAFGELYMDGRIVFDRGALIDLSALLAKNAVRREAPRIITFIRKGRDLISSIATRNPRRKARENVAHHYDLDKRLYEFFLDSDRQYSCAYFERPDMSLDEAQLAKKRHIAAKLMIEPGQRVLDIGCGWGGMALYLARHCGADVTGITLSQEQFGIAEKRAREAGLAERARFRIEDYRDTRETFDRIVSVGMFEHVGPPNYDAFFGKIAECLAEDGVALLHTIGRPDGPGAVNPWVTKYIFPGGYIPALSEAVASIERMGLFITDVEILRMHYAETLKAWRERFMARREEVKALYDERFCRMWEFYLTLSETAFRYEGECVFQIQIARRHDRVPITRDYIADGERRLRASETREEAFVVA